MLRSYHPKNLKNSYSGRLFCLHHFLILSLSGFTGFMLNKPIVTNLDMGVSKDRGTPKSSILIGFSIINHPFWGTIMFGNTNIFI